MTGPLIYGFSIDAVAAAKEVVADFAKTNDKLVIAQVHCWENPGHRGRQGNWRVSLPREVLLAQLCGFADITYFAYRCCSCSIVRQRECRCRTEWQRLQTRRRSCRSPSSVTN
jgi:hypothetical protein